MGLVSTQLSRIGGSRGAVVVVTIAAAAALLSSTVGSCWVSSDRVTRDLECRFGFPAIAIEEVEPRNAFNADDARESVSVFLSPDTDISELRGGGIAINFVFWFASAVIAAWSLGPRLSQRRAWRSIRFGLLASAFSAGLLGRPVPFPTSEGARIDSIGGLPFPWFSIGPAQDPASAVLDPASYQPAAALLSAMVIATLFVVIASWWPERDPRAVRE